MTGAVSRAGFRLAIAALLVHAAAPVSIAAQHPRITRDDSALEAPARAIEAHVRFLADDLMEGREAGTRGDRLTQLYVASQFARLGLQPAGDSGGYLQDFRVRGTTLAPDSVSFEVIGASGVQSFRNGTDIAFWGDPVEAEQEIEAPVVFAGYGIVAPGRGIDDYAGLDVRGKIVAVLGGPPAFLPPSEAAHFGSTDQQRLTAAALGAAGVIHLWTPALETRFPFDGLEALLGRTDLAWIGRDGQPNVTAPSVRLRGFTRGDSSAALFAGSRRSFENVLAEAATGSPAGFPLSTRVRLTRRSRHDDSLATANVLGMIPGSDPALANQVVVVTAHFDHVGIGAPANGDRIYNGALDNAAGTAILIEMARRIQAAPVRPRRPILFAAVAAEEKGLIGSDYLAAHPARDRRIVANVNIDGALPFYDFADVIGFGADQSQLAERLTVAAGQLGLAFAPDPFPAEGFFTRSDQYSFARRGIPALFLFTGFTDMAGHPAGRRVWEVEGARLTHQPIDDVTQPIDYAVLAKLGEVARRLVLEVANHPTPPLWYAGSPFAPRGAPVARRPGTSAH